MEKKFCNEEFYEFSSADYYSFRRQSEDFLNFVRTSKPLTQGTVDEDIRTLELIGQVYDRSEFSVVNKR